MESSELATIWRTCWRKVGKKMNRVKDKFLFFLSKVGWTFRWEFVNVFHLHGKSTCSVMFAGINEASMSVQMANFFFIFSKVKDGISPKSSVQLKWRYASPRVPVCPWISLWTAFCSCVWTPRSKLRFNPDSSFLFPIKSLLVENWTLGMEIRTQSVNFDAEMKKFF